MTKKLTNLTASIRERLLQRARAAGEEFQLVLTEFANERSLYRLGASDYRDRFILKGATLFTLWDGRLHRPTRDLDLLGTGSSQIGDVVALARQLQRKPGSTIMPLIAQPCRNNGERAQVGDPLLWPENDIEASPG